MIKESQFANELKLYRKYKIKLKELKVLIKDVVEYNMTGVKGINPSGSKGSSNPATKFDNYYKLSLKLEELKKQEKMLKDYINYVDRKLKKIKDKNIRQAIIDMYVDNISVRKLCKKYGYSKSGIFYQMRKALKEIDNNII